MKVTHKQWVRELRAIFEGEGGAHITVAPTNGNHLRVTGEFDGRPRSLVCSMSPSDHRVAYKIRTDLRRLLRTPPPKRGNE